MRRYAKNFFLNPLIIELFFFLESLFAILIEHIEIFIVYGGTMQKFIGNKAFYRTVLTIAIPIMIQNAITNFVGL